MGVKNQLQKIFELMLPFINKMKICKYASKTSALHPVVTVNLLNEFEKHALNCLDKKTFCQSRPGQVAMFQKRLASRAISVSLSLI